MRIHPVVWFGALVVGAMALWAVINDNDAEKSATTWLTGGDSNTDSPLSDRDNAAEEVRAVATRIANIEQAIETQASLNQIKQDELRASIESNVQRIKLSGDNTRQQEVIEQIADSLDALQRRMHTLENQRDTTPNEVAESIFDGTEFVWISSSDTEFASMPYDTLPAELVNAGDYSLNERGVLGQFGRSDDIAHFTIPATTTLLNATALTALVGRIPVRGQLRDPWRFKVIVGADNLASNGHRIPRLAGMLLAGTARGDLSLSCVSGNIDTATFIFADGTIQTTRESSNPEDSYAGLGWISDQFGNPCIAGELKSNALQYLSQATLVNTAQATAEAIANAQTETSTTGNSGNTTTSVVGDIDQFVAGYATKESLSTVAQWLNERQLNSFDAIYVPAGHSVAIHVEQAIHIDQDPAARKVQNFNPTVTHVNARQGWID